MSNEAFTVIIALVLGPLFGLAGLGALSHTRRFRTATLRTQGWQVSLHGYDDESTTVPVDMFWYVHGRRYDGRVQVKCQEVEQAQGVYALVIDPKRPTRAFMASDKPSPILGIAAVLYGLASLIHLGTALLGVIGVETPEAVRSASGWTVAGGLGLILAVSVVGAAVWCVWLVVSQVYKSVRRVING